MPPISYMHQVYHADAVILEKRENYQKQTYRNRFEIFGANGRLALTIPVIKVRGNHTPIDEVLVSSSESWTIKHWRAIESAYNASPFFMHYQDELYSILSEENTSLFELNLRLLNGLIELIGFEKKISFTGEYKEELTDMLDLRNTINPKSKGSVYSFNTYQQVFMEKHGFIEDLSIIDLLFNEGPATLDYLRSGIKKK